MAHVEVDNLNVLVLNPRSGILHSTGWLHLRNWKNILCLQEHGDAFSATSFEWAHVKHRGLENHCLRAQLNRELSCGKILFPAKDQLTNFRENIGVRLGCFKLGITSNPLVRSISYLKKGYTKMWLISVSHSSDTIEMLEAALAGEYAKHVGRQNQSGTGGEGAPSRASPPPPPYFCYIVGARADQDRRIGWEGNVSERGEKKEQNAAAGCALSNFLAKDFPTNSKYPNCCVQWRNFTHTWDKIIDWFRSTWLKQSLCKYPVVCAWKYLQFFPHQL